MTPAKAPGLRPAGFLNPAEALRETDAAVAEGLAVLGLCLSSLRDLRAMAEEQMRLARELKREYRDLRVEVEDALERSFALSPALLERYSGKVVAPLRTSSRSIQGEDVQGDPAGAENRLAPQGEPSSDREEAS